MLKVSLSGVERSWSEISVLLTGSKKSRPTTCKAKKLRLCHNFVLIQSACDD